MCAKVMQDCDGEFADGGVVQKDFQALMESHIAAWSANTESYKIKQPVRNIGLQRHILPPKFSDWKPEMLPSSAKPQLQPQLAAAAQAG